VRPLTVLTGIILGSAAATTFGLVTTLVVFMVLSDEIPRFRAELPLLGGYAVLFAGLTALAALSFVGQAKQRPWRRAAQAAMWAALAALAALYWATRD
jgi:hypothetical protein